MGALGFTVAVGASSFSSSTMLNFQNTGIEEVSNGVGSDGFKFPGKRASFVDTGSGGIAVAVKTKVGSSDNFKSLDALGAGPVKLKSPPLDISPLHPIESDGFELISSKLSGNVFDLTERGFIASAFGQKAGSDFFNSRLEPRGDGGIAGARAFGVAGTPLASLGPSLGTEPETALATFADEDADEESPTAVPIPASALLLATALLGAGAFARRKTQS